MQQCYQRLIAIAQQSRRQAERVAAARRERDHRMAERLAERLEQLRSAVAPVVGQTQRRVLAGERVPAAEQCVSLFEPHTQVLT